MSEPATTHYIPTAGTGCADAIARQHEMQADLLTIPMFRMAQRMGSLIELRNALEYTLLDEIEQLPYCCLFVLDVNGRQITANVGHACVDRSQYARDRSGCVCLKDIIGVSDFRLSAVYPGSNNRRPSITAVQVIRDRYNRRVGYIGADFELRELPHSGAVCRDPEQWRQLQVDLPVRSGLCYRQRAGSVVDRHIDSILVRLAELVTRRGVFHVKLHCSANRATLRQTDDPYHYRLLGLQELTNPDLCQTYSPRACPGLAAMPESAVADVLERFRLLRDMDEAVYLHSGSLNIFNGSVGVNFSCAGTRHMNYREFLARGVAFWTDARCVS